MHLWINAQATFAAAHSLATRIHAARFAPKAKTVANLPQMSGRSIATSDYLPVHQHARPECVRLIAVRSIEEKGSNRSLGGDQHAH